MWFVGRSQLTLRTEGCHCADDLGAVLTPHQHPTLLQLLTASVSWKLPAGFMMMTTWVQTTWEAGWDTHGGLECGAGGNVQLGLSVVVAVDDGDKVTVVVLVTSLGC